MSDCLLSDDNHCSSTKVVPEKQVRNFPVRKVLKIFGNSGQRREIVTRRTIDKALGPKEVTQNPLSSKILDNLSCRRSRDPLIPKNFISLEIFEILRGFF